MTTTFRGRDVCLSVLLAMAVVGAAVPGATAASLSAGAEFDRITADIRAAIERHDPRAAHQFGAQLDRLIARATGT